MHHLPHFVWPVQVTFTDAEIMVFNFSTEKTAREQLPKFRKRRDVVAVELLPRQARH